MKLSNRLECLYQLIPQDARVVDIGTDHGLLLIRAIETNRALHGYGVDINPGPLQQARENLVRFGMEDRIDLILSDGLNGFTQKADCFVLAGMGAETIWDIIKDFEFKDDATLIVQSNTKHAWFRQTASENGFKIVDEVFMIDKGVPVFIIVMKKGSQVLSFSDTILGPILRHNIHGEYHFYLLDQHRHLNNIKHNQAVLMDTFEVLDRAVGKGSSYE